MTRDKLAQLNTIERKLTLQEQQYAILQNMNEDTELTCDCVGSIKLCESDRKAVLDLLYERYQKRIDSLKKEFENA